MIGYRSIATPGSVAGHGLRRAQIWQARTEARDGSGHQAGSGWICALSAEEAHELADPDLARFPDSKRIFQRDGQLYKAGEIFKQPELARTLERIAADPDDFYHGKMAHELIDDLKKGGALITLEDLAQYTVVERKPVTGTFHNYTIISAPPPSSGGMVLVSALNILEGYDLAKLGDRTACLDASDHRGLSARLHGSRRLPRRSRLQPHSRCGTDREEIRRRVAQQHLAEHGQPSATLAAA